MPIRKILNVNLTGRWFVSRILWLDVHLDKHVNMLISTIILNVFIYPWSQVSSCWVKKTDLFLKPWSLIDLRCLARNIPDINLVNISILIAFCLLLETLETSHADVVVERAVHWIFIGWLLSIFSMTRWILLFFERKTYSSQVSSTAMLRSPLIHGGPSWKHFNDLRFLPGGWSLLLPFSSS